MYNLFIANRAMELMQAELTKYPDDETGGILLGYVHKDDKETEVLEAIDSGIKSVHKPSSFIYDAEYVEHVADIISRIYYPHLKVIGVWHKHNHSLNPPFSFEDNKMHKQMLKICKEGAVSILFQKTGDDEYILRTFIINEDGSCIEVEAEF